MPTAHAFLATAPSAAEPFLLTELSSFGALDAKPMRLGAAFSGPLALAYRACLFSRVASRMLLKLHSFAAPDADALYDGISAVDWSEHLTPQHTFAVTCTGTHHNQYGAQRVKDAVVDQLRQRHGGARPSVDKLEPDIRLHVSVHHEQALVCLDLSGSSLHRRGYRRASVEATLKENVAAIMLLRAGWPQLAASGAPLIDPMCGSGTLPIEAALMAADIAPGLLRTHFGFLGWLQHDAALWQQLRREAQERRRAGLARRLPPIAGFDCDPHAIQAARDNARQAELPADWPTFTVQELGLLRPSAALDAAAPPTPAPTAPVTSASSRRSMIDTSAPARGLLVVNPPYGERLGHVTTLRYLYARLGKVLQEHFSGWRAWVLTDNRDLGQNTGLRAVSTHALHNGPLACQLLEFVLPLVPATAREPTDAAASSAPLAAPPTTVASAEVAMVANRLRKNLRSLGQQAARQAISCYRLYDADMPEYAAAIDIYERFVHVQEYQAPSTIAPAKANARLGTLLKAIDEVLKTPPDRLFVKQRRRQRGLAQYEKMDDAAQFFKVQESGHTFFVNFTDHLDTGLFLDHRLTRQKIGALARGAHFLNLFGYTATATVYAAKGGAKSTTTVDMSAVYLRWARQNMVLNHVVGPNHRLVQANCLEWLEQAGREEARHYDLIFLDPPTFSNSKRMQAAFDIQRDHQRVLQQTMQLLAADGLLIFSTNFRRFKLDPTITEHFAVEEISASTIPFDFQRTPRMHRTWLVRHRSPGNKRAKESPK